MIVVGGSEESVPPGEGVRFRVVASDGRHGSSWLVRTNVGRGDVYLSHREGGQWAHVSLHGDGRRHFAITPAGRELEPDAEPYLEISRETNYVQPGWQLLARVTVAATELRPWAEAKPGKGVIDVEMPDGCDALALDVYLPDVTAEPVPLNGPSHVATLRRGDGGLAVIVAGCFEVEKPVPELFAGEIAQARSALRATRRWDGTTGVRVVLMLPIDGGGPLHQVEFAVDPD